MVLKPKQHKRINRKNLCINQFDKSDTENDAEEEKQKKNKLPKIRVYHYGLLMDRK